MTTAATATPLDPARPLDVPGPLRRTAGVVGDLLAAAAIIISIPFVILALGIPVALGVRSLLWIVGLF
jgi:hypothetical protein